MKQMTKKAAQVRATTVNGVVLDIITGSRDSLSAAEVSLRYTASTGRSINDAALYNAIGALEKKGLIFARRESAAERATRGGGRVVPGKLASLYSTKNPVPVRTHALSDVVLGDGKATANSRLNKLRGVSNEAAKTSSRGLIDSFTSIVKERDELAAQVKRLESTLSGIRVSILKL